MFGGGLPKIEKDRLEKNERRGKVVVMKVEYVMD